jgi:hypothetical protein
VRGNIYNPIIRQEEMQTMKSRKGCIVWFVLLLTAALYLVNVYRNRLIPTSTEATSQTTTMATALPTVSPPPLVYPENGHLFIKPSREGMNQITVKTTGNDAYLVKLADGENGEAVRFFVTPGSTTNIGVPDGTYELSYAAGKTWYGLQYLFGSETYCNRFEDLLTFSVHTEGLTCYYTTYEVTFYGVVDGNASTEPISVEEFLK